MQLMNHTLTADNKGLWDRPKKGNVDLDLSNIPQSRFSLSDAQHPCKLEMVTGIILRCMKNR